MSYPITTKNEKQYKQIYGFNFHAETNDKVIDLLVNAFTMKKRIRIFYGDTKTGRCWMNEYNMSGAIGRLSGQIKIPLMIANSRSIGGSAILEHCIIAIQCQNIWLYKHEKFNMPEMILLPSDLSEYSTMVLFDGEIQARFKKLIQAERYIAFMKGERACK